MVNIKGQKIGYIRVSTSEQNPERQLNGLELDKKFIDYASGKDTNRPAFQEMIGYIREGDRLYVHSMDRLSRNFNDLRNTVIALNERKISVEFLTPFHFVYDCNTSPYEQLIFNLMGSVAEMERALIRERQLEGIALAKKKGAYKGRSPCLTKEEAIALQERIRIGIPKLRVAREFGVSKDSVYKYMRMQVA